MGLRLTSRRCRFWQKISSFQMKLTDKSHVYIEKPTHPKRVTVWCGFWSRSIIGQFFFENKQGEGVTVNRDRYRAMLNEFLFTKIEEEDIGNIWFQQEGATCHIANLHSMFCAMFMKITLSDARLMWFGHFEAVIWHRWTIIYGVPSKITVMPTSQRNWSFKGQCSWSHWWNTTTHNR